LEAESGSHRTIDQHNKLKTSVRPVQGNEADDGSRFPPNRPFNCPASTIADALLLFGMIVNTVLAEGSVCPWNGSGAAIDAVSNMRAIQIVFTIASICLSC
jgi:hypothetical protein